MRLLRLQKVIDSRDPRNVCRLVNRVMMEMLYTQRCQLESVTLQFLKINERLVVEVAAMEVESGPPPKLEPELKP